MNPRTCICGNPIGHLHGLIKYCSAKCRKEARDERYSRWFDDDRRKASNARKRAREALMRQPRHCERCAKNISHRSSRAQFCTECAPKHAAENRRLYNIRNKKRMLEVGRKWRKANRERIRKRQRDWHAKNTEKTKVRNLAWCAANRDKVRKRANRYYQLQSAALRILKKRNLVQLGDL